MQSEHSIDLASALSAAKLSRAAILAILRDFGQQDVQEKIAQLSAKPIIEKNQIASRATLA